MSIRIITSDDLYHQCYCPFLFIIFLSILFVHLPSLFAISFNYPNFSNTQNLILSREAFSANGILSLTKNIREVQFSVGRAVYSQEMHLWDNATGKVADFVTHFSFNISKFAINEGDGFTFFLGPNGSQIPDLALGGCLGLVDNCSDFNTTGKAIVAVEFDTYRNAVWDPSDNHVGINVNSIRSVATSNTSIRDDGSKANAWVTYNSQTGNLSMFLTYADNPIFSGNSSLSYKIDLPKVLPEFVNVGFSSSTRSHTKIYNILSWEFNSTEISGGRGGGNSIGLIVGCVIGGLVAVAGLISILVFYGKINKSKKDDDDDDDAATDDSMDHEFKQGIGPKRFSYQELVQATNNFSEKGKLGEGGFGGVYRGHLSDLDVAVKRVSKRSKQGRKEYMSEVKIISKLRHKNLLQLVGWCHEKGELLLIYEFMPNGSLDSYLFRGENMLSWAVRYNIALGLASALLYLHEEWEQCVVHRDIKSSNVMLDSNFNTKLGDFGLARLMDNTGIGLKTTGLAGTVGYMAPEYISTGKASKGSDVFSFGVVALEIACGRRSIESRNVDEQISLVSWAWESYGNGRILDVADRRLSMDFNVDEMECLLIVGLWCAHPDNSLRPSIRQALQVLNFEAALPNLPAKMPVPKFDVPSSSTSSAALLSTSSVITGR